MINVSFVTGKKKDDPRKPWITKEIIDMIKKRNLLYEQSLNSQDDADFTVFKRVKNKMNGKRGQTKRNIMNTSFQVIREILKRHGKSLMSLWEFRKVASRLALTLIEVLCER